MIPLTFPLVCVAAIAVVFAAVNSTKAATTQPASTQPASTQATEAYDLVWSDEFNHDGPLDANDWGFEHGFARNGELQWYQPENATCKDGCLVIEARRENRPNPNFDSTRPKPSVSQADYDRGAATDRDWRNRPAIDYSAASVSTHGKHEWLYGRFEIRAKIDVRSGSWPAFWMLGSHGPWPACGEIDIMEYYHDVVLANVAWAGTSGETWNSKRVPLSKLAKDFAEQFHTWRMDWDADSMKLYLDDELVNSQDLTATINRTPLPRGAVANPFHAPMYILLNQAIGGTRGRDPSNTEFPIRYLIDYVRVWQTPAQKALQTR